jgi:hypothetical protein
MVTTTKILSVLDTRMEGMSQLILFLKNYLTKRLEAFSLVEEELM